jgi:predicted helicase
MPRAETMQHMTLGSNLAITTTRSIEIGRGWEHILCTAEMIQHHAVSLKEVNYLFPLYLYPNGDLFDNGETSDAPGGRRPNLNAEFIKDVAKKIKLKFIPDGVGDLKKTFGPENIFHYMYAVFHSPTYRSRYAEFLKIDFPRLPLTTKRPLFRALCGLGTELVGLHLMEQHGPPLARFEQEGDSVVDKVRYTDEIAAASASQPPRNDDQSQVAHGAGKVWINQTQYFEGVPREVWEFHIGGYQVCHKWLKDRKGRTLSIDDIEHYQHIVSALSETIRLMAEIDATIDQHAGWPIQ